MNSSDTRSETTAVDEGMIRRVVEAALLASPQPLTTAQLAALFGDDNAVQAGEVQQAITALQADSAERGVELVEVSSGYRFQVRADVHPLVSRLWTERQTKYTRATLETLALIAYRQPITRGEIEQIRGVGINANMIKALEEREWIRVIGHRDVPGRPELFGTTKGFLDYFGIKSLDQLPPLAEINDLPELEPQFPFEMTPPAVANAALADELMPGDDASNDTNNEAGDDAEPEIRND